MQEQSTGDKSFMTGEYEYGANVVQHDTLSWRSETDGSVSQSHVTSRCSGDLKEVDKVALGFILKQHFTKAFKYILYIYEFYMFIHVYILINLMF
jgi:hypothetical protein